jgi:hypothetical protein
MQRPRFSKAFRTVIFIAGVTLVWAGVSPRPSGSQEVIAEILNFPEAPFELLPGPEEENAPNWGAMLNLSFFVRNTSTTTLYHVTVRMEMRKASPTKRVWFGQEGIDLGRPDGLEPGEVAYVLITRSWCQCLRFCAAPSPGPEGPNRLVLLPEAAEGFRSFSWRKQDRRKLAPMPIPPGAPLRLVAKSRVDVSDRPFGTSACAGLRTQVLGGCTLGIDRFKCVARPQGVPAVERGCIRPDQLERRKPVPGWCVKDGR